MPWLRPKPCGRPIPKSDRSRSHTAPGVRCLSAAWGGEPCPAPGPSDRPKPSSTDQRCQAVPEKRRTRENADAPWENVGERERDTKGVEKRGFCAESSTWLGRFAPSATRGIQHGCNGVSPFRASTWRPFMFPRVLSGAPAFPRVRRSHPAAPASRT